MRKYIGPDLTLRAGSFVGGRKPVNTGTHGLIRIMYTRVESAYRCAYMT